MRYAGYIRISSDDQIGNFSIDAQQRAMESWVQAQSGELVQVYIDEAESGRSIDRNGFLQMRRDANKGKFDALLVYKFDRIARNRADALAIKSLLRRDYGIKVFSISEPSEDSDGAMGALIEGLMDCVAEWYSRNLAEETTKGKRERALQGYHNNRPPFGYDKNADKILVPNEHERIGLLYAFEQYATSQYSDNEIARLLNERGYLSKTGRPFSTDTVRDMLQNRTYLGYVKYQKHKQRDDGSRSMENPVEWIPGKHEAIIPQDLFDRCQDLRAYRALSRHDYHPKHNIYLLQGIIHCARCEANKPDDIQDESYSRMRPYGTRGFLFYRCRAHDFGRQCPQKVVWADDIERQVVRILTNLNLPPDVLNHMIESMESLLDDKKLEKRISEIKGIIDQTDFRWELGFITDKNAYLEQRAKFQKELDQLAPIVGGDLEEVGDILKNFEAHWATLADNYTAQQELLKLIIARVWVKGECVVALTLRPNYYLTIANESENPA